MIQVVSTTNFFVYNILIFTPGVTNMSVYRKMIHEAIAAQKADVDVIKKKGVQSSSWLMSNLM